MREWRVGQGSACVSLCLDFCLAVPAGVTSNPQDPRTPHLGPRFPGTPYPHPGLRFQGTPLPGVRSQDTPPQPQAGKLRC